MSQHNVHGSNYSLVNLPDLDSNRVALICWAIVETAAIAGAVCMGVHDHPWLALMFMVVAGAKLTTK